MCSTGTRASNARCCRPSPGGLWRHRATPRWPRILNRSLVAVWRGSRLMRHSAPHHAAGRQGPSGLALADDERAALPRWPTAPCPSGHRLHSVPGSADTPNPARHKDETQEPRAMGEVAHFPRRGRGDPLGRARPGAMGAPEPAAVLVTALTAPFLSALAPYVDQRSPARARVDEFSSSAPPTS